MAVGGTGVAVAVGGSAVAVGSSGVAAVVGAVVGTLATSVGAGAGALLQAASRAALLISNVSIMVRIGFLFTNGCTVQAGAEAPD
ncbi:MAG: hypothetical protein HC893_05685 [Chloroflexaceae bacterium]|nr:hypothetical protein [Chloroflexaceae bacterium]